jgi:hypothetical protein
MKKNTVMLCLAVLVCLSASSGAALVFKITSDNSTLAVNQTTTMHVWGWANDPKAIGTNGLADWALNMVVNNGGIVEITKDVNTNGDITILAPSPLSTLSPNWNYSSVNAVKTGQVSNVNALRNPDNASTTGIGTYTELFQFNIKAISEGNVIYSMTNMIGDLADFKTAFDSGDGSAIFDAAGSSNILTVVPEPTTLVILSGFGIAGLLTRRKK